MVGAVGATCTFAPAASQTDAVCTEHTSTRASTGVAALACGLLPVTQMSLVFYDRVAYNDYAFLMEIEECCQLVEDLGDKNVMIMRNHGLLTAAGSAGEAFMRMYYLDKACEIQLDALARRDASSSCHPTKSARRGHSAPWSLTATRSVRWSGPPSSASSSVRIPPTALDPPFRPGSVRGGDPASHAGFGAAHDS